MESWVSLGVKEGYTNIQISAEMGTEPGTLWLQSRDLTNCTNQAIVWLVDVKGNQIWIMQTVFFSNSWRYFNIYIMQKRR